MDLEHEYKLTNIENDVQDKSSEAWVKLCEYVDKIADEGSDEFSPFKYLGKELYMQIYTLPESIRKLKNVKRNCLSLQKRTSKILIKKVWI